MFGLKIQASMDGFHRPFYQKLQAFLKGLPGAVCIETASKGRAEWQLHGSAAALAQNNLETFSGTTVVIEEAAIALHFPPTTVERYSSKAARSLNLKLLSDRTTFTQSINSERISSRHRANSGWPQQ